MGSLKKVGFSSPLPKSDPLHVLALELMDSRGLSRSKTLDFLTNDVLEVQWLVSGAGIKLSCMF